ncbi:MAG: hypothetical protein ACYC41_05440 [Bacillota bacterium]
MAYSVGSAGSNGEKRYPVAMVRKVRKLPLPGEVLAKVGDQIDPETIVAKISLKPGIPWVVPVARLVGIEPAALPAAMTRKVGDRVKTKEIIARAEKGIYGRKEYEAPTDGVIEDISEKSGRVVIREEFGKEEPPVSFDAAFELGCKPRDLPKFMIKKIGDEVKRGQFVAKKGEAQAFFTKTARTPISGIIAEVNDQTGYVTIARPFKEVVVKGYIKGVAREIVPARGIVVEAPAVRLTGIFGVGRETHGDLKILCQKADQTLTDEMITAECEGKIVVGGAFATNEALKKAVDTGVKGVITGTASYLNIVKSLGVKLGVGITGQEEIGTTVILLEGFGHLAMHEEAFNVLKSLEGRHASINGATQIRAGAIRPEVIVPFSDWTGEVTETKPVDEDLSIGQAIRVINAPYFGELGRITAIPREPVVVETEARVPVVEVELASNSQRAVVPRANVEVF